MARQSGSKNKPKRFTAAGAFQTLTAADLGMDEAEAQGVAVKLTGRTVERTEAQQDMDGAVLGAWDEYVAAGKPEDKPGSRIVKFIPLAQESEWEAMTPKQRAEVAEDAKELGAMLYSAGTYITKNNGHRVLVHVHGIRHVPPRDPQWTVLSWSVAEKPANDASVEG